MSNDMYDSIKWTQNLLLSAAYPAALKNRIISVCVIVTVGSPFADVHLLPDTAASSALLIQLELLRRLRKWLS